GLPRGSAGQRDVEPTRSGDRVHDEPNAVRRRVDAQPRLRDERLTLRAQRHRIGDEPQRRLPDRDPAAARGWVLALATGTRLAARTVRVRLAGLGPTDQPVSAHDRPRGAHAPGAAGARVGAGETGLTALLARVDRPVAAMDELLLVGSDVDPRADRPRVAVEIQC